MSHYQVDVLIQGFPGRSVCHGGLGWSTVSLIRGQGRTILLDVGAFGMRAPLKKRLSEFALKPEDVTDIILTHAHYDHIVNFILFPNATIWIGDTELSWATSQPPGFNPIPELYVQELVNSIKVKRISTPDEFLPYIKSYPVPGHTPGHLLFVLNNGDTDVIFTGDAAKNRAELMSRKVVDTASPIQSSASIDLIFEKWCAKPNSLLIPGHDLTMRLDENNQPIYLGERKDALIVWFSETIESNGLIYLNESTQKE
jgi:N-acyl homoserine lactone hydrolase